MLSYFFAFKSYYINKHLSLKSFDNPLMTLIINYKKNLFLNKKQNYILIAKNIFKKIIEDKLLFVIDFNIDKMFKTA